jgi:class 3 adenylate cyclase/Tol biopolymer transport system component
MAQSRQLAAIMFTDIVGYTMLMGKNSEKTLELIRTSRGIQKPLVEKYKGHWLKEIGDGAMAKFNSAVDAVNCAIQIQRICRADFEAQLRIGIHLGDIAIENNDVYGDGVNVASRLESLADPGGILISESVERAIHGQTGIETSYLNEVTLKNVEYPIKVYAIRGVGLPKPRLMKSRDNKLAFQKRRKKTMLNALLISIPIILLILIVTIFLPYLRGSNKNQGNTLIQLQIRLPDDIYVAANSNYPALTVSPDGMILIFAGVKNGQRQLFKRKLNDPTIEMIPGTENALAPFFSKDGEWVGFFQKNMIKKIATNGDSPIPVHYTTPDGVYRGATWYTNDSIIYSGSLNDGIGIGSAIGDKIHSLKEWKSISERNNLAQLWPEVINETQCVLFTALNTDKSDNSDICLLSLRSREQKVLVSDGTFAKYSDGQILFTRGNSLYAIPFDIKQNDVGGSETQLVKSIMNNVNGSSQLSVGGSTLAYIEGNENVEKEYLAWVDRSGKVDKIFTNGKPFLNPKFSPDGNYIAIVNYQHSNQDIWLFDVNRETFSSRITTHPGEDFAPVWNPNGKELAIASEIAEDEGEIGPGISLLSINSEKPSKRIFKTPEFGYWEFPTSWSPDGKWLLYSCSKGESIYDIEVLNLVNNERQVVMAHQNVHETGAVFSPNGKWIAYVSDFTGRAEIYIIPFHGEASPKPVSVAGGFEPLWSQDGKKLFYRENDKLMEVLVLNQESMELSVPNMLFRGTFKENHEGGDRSNYEISKDDKRFLMIYRDNMPRPDVINVILNWKGLLKNSQLK